MNPLCYFRKLDEADKGDDQEGTYISAHYKAYTKNGELLCEGEIKFRLDAIDYSPIFCLALPECVQENNTFEFAPDRLIKAFYQDDGDVYSVVCISKTLFIDRIESAARKQGLDLLYGPVKYDDANLSYQPNDPYAAAFHKRTSYSYQNEYRLLLQKEIAADGHYNFQIGDIHDIACEAFRIVK